MIQLLARVPVNVAKSTKTFVLKNDSIILHLMDVENTEELLELSKSGMIQ